VILFAKEVSSSSELRVRDEAGNITTLSPHNFSLLVKSEPMAWSYYSENAELDQKINVDMLKVIREVERMSGKKLVEIESTQGQFPKNEDLQKGNEGQIIALNNEIKELKNIIEKLQVRLEALEN